MAKVWKIGSRWSPTGEPCKSVLSIFRRNNIVFVGGQSTSRFLKEVKEGDYFAIADGNTVVAVAKAISDPIENLCGLLIIRDNEKNIFDESAAEYAAGVKVKIVDLDEPFKYEERHAFRAALKIWDKVIKLYDNQNVDFDIVSNAYTVVNAGDGKKFLLDGKTRFIIPVYQRPYSWGPEQIARFVKDLFYGFLGYDRSGKHPEPMFIGTMQLSTSKFVSDNEIWQEVIDGQQRITTVSVILKELSKIRPENGRLKNLSYDWLETQVSKEQMQYMEDYFQDKNVWSEDLNNKYAINAKQISQLLQDFLSSDYASEDNEDAEFNVDPDKLAEYVLENIYFVVIETKAGLSKTLKIFNTINTSGLDLNGGDLFKIRMYEYMTDILKYDKMAAFDEISKVYGLIDAKNKVHGSQIISIGGVLSVYRDYLIGQYELPSYYFDYSWERFFDNLFDTLLKISGPGNTAHMPAALSNSLKVDLEEIIDIVNVMVDWHDRKFSNSKFPSKEAMFAFRMIERSRYGRYTRVVYPFLYKYRNMEAHERYARLYELLIELNKVLFLYSIRYAKAVNGIHTFMHEVFKSIINEPLSEVLKVIENKRNDAKGWAKAELSKPIADNRVWKNQICRLSEHLEITCSNADIDIETEERLLFYTPIDIEHIHASADGTINWQDGDLQNSIGNLAMLEYDINRSIGSKPFKEKCHSSKGYTQSKYMTIKKLAESNLPEWNERNAHERREVQVGKMYSYLFNEQ